MVGSVHRDPLLSTRRYRHIKVPRIGGDAFHWTFPSPELSADYPRARPVVVGHLWNIGGEHVLITRRRHLQRRGKVRPQLKPVHAPVRIALRHLLVQDAAARGHPLHVASTEAAAVAEAVAVLDRSGEDIRDRLDAAVGMPRKAGLVVVGTFVAEIVE